MFQKQHSRKSQNQSAASQVPCWELCFWNSEGWGPTHLFFFLKHFFLQTQSLCSHYYLWDLALNQGQRRSTFWLLITMEMLTYFQSIIIKEDGGPLWPPAKPRVSALCLSCRKNAAVSIIASQKATETWKGEHGRSNKDTFQVSACWDDFCSCTANK